MPKKAPKNGFYYFMLDFKGKQQKKGIHYNNMTDVAAAADPEWRNAPTSVRLHFEDIAKKEKNRNRAPEKYTSSGIPISVIQRQQKELEDAMDFEREDIKDMIKTKVLNNNQVLEEDFFVMDVNAMCKTENEYLIGESSVLRFSLRKGFKDFYHELINPGFIPYGYAYDVKMGCAELGLDMPDDSKEKANYLQILANLIDYLKQSDKTLKTLPPLYTMPDKVALVQDFINMLCHKAGEDEMIFRVYRVDTLFYQLINAIRTRKDEGFPKESLALLQLKKDVFKYSLHLGCEHHEAKDLARECTASRTKRWAYTIMDSCCPLVGIDLKPGLHVPKGCDIEGIIAIKEEKKVARALPTVAAWGGHSSFDSTLNDSTRDTSVADSSVASAEPRREKRTNAPMRMPQADYSASIRPAPELTDDNFPALSSGAGRGRGLSRSFNKMNINK
ncbi:germ-plasm component protein maelstrom isoform X2 [Anticarsia gemmatalis]|uniref:germ-plasm component protein maelstrom isoform X2 n=1 Tax=Anticarsia gemmatalis TaxID=129554 RepID=UPI003F7764B5